MTCKHCGQPILVSIFRGMDWCSDNCRKALGQDPSDPARNKNTS